jgi:hypothetical protein
LIRLIQSIVLRLSMIWPLHAWSWFTHWSDQLRGWNQYSNWINFKWLHHRISFQ